jgi:glycosyltransferase 2 family protein
MRPRTARLVHVVLVGVILALLVVFAQSVNWTETWAAIRGTSLGLLALAALVNLLSLALKGVRWWIFLRPVGAPSLSLALRATFAGAALNNVLVANSGEAARVIFVARTAHVQSATVLATLALERLFELVGYVVMLATAVSILRLPPALDRTRPFAFAALVVVIVLLGYLVRHPESAAIPIEGEGLFARARNYLRRFMQTLTTISTMRRFVASLALSVAVWSLQVVTYALTARAAHFDLPVVGTVAALLAVNIGFAVRATPGNVGVFQMVYAVSAAAFGFDKDQATAVAFLIQTQQILPVTLIGLVAAPQMIFAKRRETPRATNILPGEPPALPP